MWSRLELSITRTRPEVVQISPSDGAVVATTNSVPAIGAVFPAVVANSGGLWLAGGPARSPNLDLIPKGSSEPKQVYKGLPSQSWIDWLAGVGSLVWANVAPSESVVNR